MKQSRREDIQNRFSLAVAERQLYDRDDRHYIQLSEVIHKILSEYRVPDARGAKIRYGFRLRGTDYALVILEKNEKY